jgi:ABC-type branched-subunit amino acid transport system substrate-binding protein
MAKQWQSATVAAIVVGVAVAFGTFKAEAQQLPQRIKIGVLVSLTGAASQGVQRSSVPAIKLAIKELQDKGGMLAGRPVDFIWGDDQSDPTQATNEARRLVEREKVQVMIGPMLSTMTLATAPIYTAAKLPSMVVAVSSAFTPQVSPYGFVMYYNSLGSSSFVAKYASEVLKAKTAVIIAGDGALDRQAVEDYRKALPARGINLLGVEIHQTSATDVTPNVLSARRANPDLLIQQTSIGEDGGLVVKTVRDFGWKVPIADSNAALYAVPYMKIAGADVFGDESIHGIVFNAFMVCKNTPLGESPFAKYMNRLKAMDPPAFDKILPYAQSFIYDGVNLLFSAIDATKSVDGPTVAAWIEANAANVPTVTGKMKAGKDDHFLFGEDAMWMITRPDVKRSDLLMNRPGC